MKLFVGHDTSLLCDLVRNQGSLVLLCGCVHSLRIGRPTQFGMGSLMYSVMRTGA